LGSTSVAFDVRIGSCCTKIPCEALWPRSSTRGRAHRGMGHVSQRRGQRQTRERNSARAGRQGERTLRTKSTRQGRILTRHLLLAILLSTLGLTPAPPAIHPDPQYARRLTFPCPSGEHLQVDPPRGAQSPHRAYVIGVTYSPRSWSDPCRKKGSPCGQNHLAGVRAPVDACT